MSMILTVKVLLTIATLGYSMIPTVADMNVTHATNPQWVGHARFHVVWQVMSYVFLALIALYLIWMPGETALLSRLWLATGLATAAYAGFFAAVFGRAIYSGENYDPNGILPYRPPFVGHLVALEVNITIFSIMAGIVVASAICLALINAA